MMNRSPTRLRTRRRIGCIPPPTTRRAHHYKRERGEGQSKIFPPISKVDSWTRSPSPHVFKTAIASCRSITQTSSRNGTAATEGVIILMLMQRDIAGRYRNAPGAGNVTGFTKRTLSALIKSKTCYQRSMGLQRTGGVHRASPQEIWSGRCAPSSSLFSLSPPSSHGQFFVRCSSVQQRRERERAKTIDVKTPIDVRPSLPTSSKRRDACPAGHRHSSSYSQVSLLFWLLFPFTGWFSGHSRNLA